MKIFQNPFVVGGLVLVAGTIIYFNNVKPMLKRNAGAPRAPAPASAPAAPAVQAPPAVPAAAPQPVEQPASPALEAGPRIEMARVNWDVNGSPPRDPFQLSTSLMPPARLVPPVGEVLKLTAIWRQTGNSLAVIDGQILDEGGTIKDYRIENIQDDQVWVTGPAGREPLRFGATPGVAVEAAPVLTGASNATKTASTP